MSKESNYPKGTIVAIGGAEDKGIDKEKDKSGKYKLDFFELGILKTIVDLVGKKDPYIEVVTTASSIPEEVFANYEEAFKKLGCNKVQHFDIRKREDADKQEILERLESCDCVMFSGGTQLKLSSIFGGTDFLDLIKDRYENEEQFVLAGTSAGAMVMSNPMIMEGSAAKGHIKGEVKIASGFGLIQDVIIDTHFDKRGRFTRLAQVIAAQPGAIGIGLSEDTGVIVSKGHQLRTIGSGIVTIIDGKHIEYNNIAEIDKDMTFSIQHLIVHIMSHYDMFDLKTRVFKGNEIGSK